jgi:hypothetical protein
MLNFDELYRNLNLLEKYIDVEIPDSSRVTKTKRQIVPPSSDFARDFLEKSKITDERLRNFELNLLLTQTSTFSDEKIRANAMILGPDEIFRSRNMDSQRMKFLFARHLIGEYNIQGNFLRSGQLFTPASSTVNSLLSSSENSIFETTELSTENYGPNDENNVRTNLDDDSMTARKRQLDATINEDLGDKRPRLDIVPNPDYDYELDRDINGLENDKVLIHVNRRQSIGGELDEVDRNLRLAKEELSRSTSLKLRTYIETFQNYLRIFEFQLLNLNTNTLETLCNIKADKVIYKNNEIFLFLNGETSLELRPIPFCGDNNCFVLKSNEAHFRLMTGDYCISAKDYLEQKVCSQISKSLPKCNFALPGVCTFEPIDTKPYYLLNGNSAILYPRNNTILQNVGKVVKKLNGINLEKPLFNVFGDVYEVLHFVFSKNQINVNFNGKTFTTWAKENVQLLLNLKPLEYALIGLSALSTLFGVFQVVMYIKYRFFEKDERNDATDRQNDIELTEQTNNLLSNRNNRRLRISGNANIRRT